MMIIGSFKMFNHLIADSYIATVNCVEGSHTCCWILDTEAEENDSD